MLCGQNLSETKKRMINIYGKDLIAEVYQDLLKDKMHLIEEFRRTKSAGRETKNSTIEEKDLDYHMD